MLSLAALQEVFKITMDTSIEAAFLFHGHDNSVFRLSEVARGLCFHVLNKDVYNTKHLVLADAFEKEQHNVFATTVADNQSRVSGRQLHQADIAKRLYDTMGRPSYHNFIRMIRENSL